MSLSMRLSAHEPDEAAVCISLCRPCRKSRILKRILARVCQRMSRGETTTTDDDSAVQVSRSQYPPTHLDKPLVNQAGVPERCVERAEGVEECSLAVQRDKDAQKPAAVCSAAYYTGDAALALDIEIGDIVDLGRGGGIPREHRGRQAVVTRIAEAHCTVAVLDDNCRVASGECWPNFADIVSIRCKTGRLGTRIIIQGMQGRMSRYNGLSGETVAHRREGHPCLAAKAHSPEAPILFLCVRLDDPLSPREKSVMVELRFLTPYCQILGQAIADLNELVATRSDRHPELAG